MTCQLVPLAQLSDYTYLNSLYLLVNVNLTLVKEAEKLHGSLFDGLKLKAEEGTVPLKTFRQH
jgi:hypothetical protein